VAGGTGRFERQKSNSSHIEPSVLPRQTKDRQQAKGKPSGLVSFAPPAAGGIGGKGGRGHPQDYFVENVFEELDDEREFYFNRSTSTLFWHPSNGTLPSDLKPGELIVPVVETLVKVSADHVRFEGLQFSHTLPTYMQPYEPTSGGDWAVHRGAATMIENATGVVFDSCVWRHIEGNGVMLSHYVRDSKLTNSEISGAGDTPVVLLGSADLMDGRAGTQPWHNEISHNYLHHFGAWGRQAAGYFEGLAGNNNVSFNVFHDGPRAVRTCWHARSKYRSIIATFRCTLFLAFKIDRVACTQKR
jgi:hypothetical protein